MKFFKLTIICGSILSVVGCSSAPTQPDTNYKPAMSAAYVDLLIEKAKAEERARVMEELASQNKDDKRFSEIKINQLESKIETLKNTDKTPVKATSNQAREQVATIESQNTSADPLLDQWKAIYAKQEEEKPSIVVKPVEVADVVYAEPTYTEPTYVEPVYAEPTYVESSYVEPVSVNSAQSASFDTVLRQCTAGQTIPNPYLGSLSEVLNSNAEPGDSVQLPTLCKWSRSNEVIAQLQAALSNQGFLKPSPPYDLEVIDGIWGINTLHSLIRYQKSKGLAYGQLSIESLVELGVINYSDVVNRKGSTTMLKSEVAPDVGSIIKPENRVQIQPEPVIEPVVKPIIKAVPKIAPPPPVAPEPVAIIEPEPVAIIESEPKEVMEAASNVTFQVKPEAEPTTSAKVADTEKGHCYVNQVIPGDYRGKIAELIKNTTNSKVGYVQELPTLCKKDRSVEIITKLQRTLYGSGYLKGGVASVTGVWNKNTLNAVRTYQKEKGLAYGQLSIEVLKELKVL